MSDKQEKKHNGNSFTRGSQVFAHNWRMKMQGFKIAALISIGMVIVWFGFQCWRKLLPMDIYYLAHIIWCDIKLTVGSGFYPIQSIGITFHDFITHQDIHMSALEFQNKIWQGQVGQRLLSFVDWLMPSAIIELVIVFIVSMIGMHWFFARRGRKNMGKETIRGTELVEPKVLIKKIKKAKEASDISIGKLPLPKNSERAHMLITGATGTGKTNLLHELLKQLESRGDKVVIFDFNATLTSIYYDPGRGDHILNPFDDRSVLWLPWVDCTQTYDYDALAGSFINDEALSEKHWTSGAKNVFAEALRKTKDEQVMSKLIETLNVLTLEQYSEFFAGSLVASSTDAKGGRSTASTRSTLSTEIHKLSYLQETTNPFSIKNYIKSNDNHNWLFVTTTPNQREALAPLLSSWLKIALNGMMERNPYESNNNVWFIVDELPSINKIPALKTILCESRKYGGCFVAGIQDVNQLFKDYGHYESLSLLNQFNTRFMFRANDKKTAELSAEIIGQQEIQETQESVSYGANTVRDGVNLNTTTHIKNLVLPSEFMRLPNFMCYAKLQGDWPATKIKMDFHKVRVKQPMFVERKPKDNKVSALSASPIA